MNTKRSTALAATVAAAAAFALITAAMFSGILPSTTTDQTVNTGTAGSTTSSSAQTSAQSSAQTSTQSTTQSSSQQSTAQQGQGTLSVLLTDPPTVPAGVTKVYLSYSNLAVHSSGAGANSGWTTVKASGSIELLGTVNVSKTISSVKISAGTYDQVRFNVTGAEVTYYGLNYSAFVQTSELTIPIVGGIGVVASTPSATIIDISPTVINTGTQSSPEFIIRSVASAYPVPSGTMGMMQEQEGFQMNLMGFSWWQTIEQKTTATLSIGAASLNATYLNLKVSNTGGNSTVLNLVTVTPVVNATTSSNPGVLPTALGQSAIFIVLKNGTLVQLFVYPTAAATTVGAISVAIFGQRGLELPPGATATLTHTHNTIILGFMGVAVGPPVGIILKGHQYLVTVIGEQSSASKIVTAT